jgi:hypothetical protein
MVLLRRRIERCRRQVEYLPGQRQRLVYIGADIFSAKAVQKTSLAHHNQVLSVRAIEQEMFFAACTLVALLSALVVFLLFQTG